MWLLFHWVYSMLFIYLLLAVLDLRYCMGFSLVAGRGLLTVVATLLQSTGSRAPRLQGVVVLGLSNGSSRPLERRLRDCGADAQFLRSTCDLPGSGIQPVSPALAGRFFTTEPTRETLKYILNT